MIRRRVANSARMRIRLPKAAQQFPGISGSGDPRIYLSRLQDILGCGNNQLSMFDAFGRDQKVGDPLNLRSSALHNDNLQTIVVVQMDVESRDDRVVELVL